MTAEVDRVVAEGQSLTAFAGRSTVAQQAAAMSRCAEFTDTLRYCLHYGWTTQSEATVRADVQQAIDDERSARRGVAPEATGDLSLADAFDQLAAMTPSERATADRSDLESAAASIEQALELDALRATSFAATLAAAPANFKILPNRVAEQETTYWCGPTSMQMIHWNYGSNTKVSQSTWATRLHTTSAGTSIQNMVQVTNLYTHWDGTAGTAPYAVVNVAGWGLASWYGLIVHRTYEARRPVVLHPILLKAYFPYLDDNGSGHFQVGRGFDNKGGAQDDWVIGYYEPWNQRRFDPSEPFIARKQWRKAINSWRANLAHGQHNIGA